MSTEPIPDPPEPNPATTLTTKLHAAADRDLKQRIEKAASEFHRAVNGNAYLALDGDNNNKHLRGVLNRLSGMIISALTDSNRKAAVDAFIAKVEALDSQLEEIQSQINHIAP